MLKDIIV